jgi:hypothetical protein
MGRTNRGAQCGRSIRARSVEGSDSRNGTPTRVEQQEIIVARKGGSRETLWKNRGASTSLKQLLKFHNSTVVRVFAYLSFARLACCSALFI